MDWKFSRVFVIIETSRNDLWDEFFVFLSLYLMKIKFKFHYIKNLIMRTIISRVAWNKWHFINILVYSERYRPKMQWGKKSQTHRMSRILHEFFFHCESLDCYSVYYNKLLLTLRQVACIFILLHVKCWASHSIRFNWLCELYSSRSTADRIAAAGAGRSPAAPTHRV